MAGNRVFVIGYPGSVGGANTECWHTIKLWRRFGLDVRLIPTWRANPEWKSRLDKLGCPTIQFPPELLADVPGLPGSTVVSFCNDQFLAHAHRFRDLGCRIVWVGCMCWLFAAERRHYARHAPFDAYVFQSEHQMRTLAPQLRVYGVGPDRCHLIRGAFDLEEFPFQPRSRGDQFVFGRLSRADPQKFSANTWEIYNQVAVEQKMARILGWSAAVETKLGTPPSWAECLPPGAESAPDFLASLHALVQINGGAQENWPRVGLEAMATGVPLIVQDKWGWREMVCCGETGFLCSEDPNEIAARVTRLARDEDLRLRMARNARRHLETALVDPEAIWAGWKRLFVETRPVGKQRVTSTAPRVGFIAPSLYCGGAERWMLSLARYMKDVRWVGTACLDHHWVHPDILAEMAGLMPVFIPGQHAPLPGICPVTSGDEAVRAVLRSADIVVAWGTRGLSRLLDGWGGSVVLVSHGSKDQWTKQVIQEGHEVATHFAAVSQAAVEPFHGIVPGEKVTVIENGIETRRCVPTVTRAEARARLGYQDCQIVVGFLGRLSAEKRPQLLARAVARLPQQYVALYVGSGHEQARVAAEAEKLLGPRVRFLPPTLHVGDVLAAMDVFFLSSPSEGCCLAVLEAMFAGVPAVATEVGALPEIRRAHGELWWPVSVCGLDEENAAAIRQAAESPEEASRRCDLAQRLVRERYTAERMAGRWRRYLRAISGGSMSARPDEAAA